jgi:hypothetical protein
VIRPMSAGQGDAGIAEHLRQGFRDLRHV